MTSLRIELETHVCVVDNWISGRCVFYPYLHVPVATCTHPSIELLIPVVRPLPDVWLDPLDGAKVKPGGARIVAEGTEDERDQWIEAATRCIRKLAAAGEKQRQRVWYSGTALLPFTVLPMKIREAIAWRSYRRSVRSACNEYHDVHEEILRRELSD